MIAFVTLLLGLISGPYPIEVTVSGPVAAVEFTLDGAPVGSRLSGSPWVERVDLGSDLRPHELVARALDTAGHEIASHAVGQCPAPPAEVEIVLANDEKGHAEVGPAHLAERQRRAADASIALTLDGEPLQVDDDGEGRAPRARPGEPARPLGRSLVPAGRDGPPRRGLWRPVRQRGLHRADCRAGADDGAEAPCRRPRGSPAGSLPLANLCRSPRSRTGRPRSSWSGCPREPKCSTSWSRRPGGRGPTRCSPGCSSTPPTGCASCRWAAAATKARRYPPSCSKCRAS